MTRPRVLLVLLVVIVASVLCGCTLFCQHEWGEADCINPKTCSLCGKTEGGISDIHDWNSADCLNPETCDLCGKTQGEALGHSWLDATCVTPKTCNVCAVTDGEALGHSWNDATCQAPKSCAVCTVTEGEPLDHVAEGDAVITVDYVEAVEKTATTCALCHEEYDVQIVPLSSLHSDGEFLFSRKQFVERINRIMKELDPDTLYELRYIDNTSNSYHGRTGQLDDQYMDKACEDFELYHNNEYIADVFFEHGYYLEGFTRITAAHGIYPPFPSFSSMIFDIWWSDETTTPEDAKFLCTAMMMTCFPELDAEKAWNIIEETANITMQCIMQCYDTRGISAWAIRNGVALQGWFEPNNDNINRMTYFHIVVLPTDSPYNVDTPTQYP